MAYSRPSATAADFRTKSPTIGALTTGDLDIYLDEQGEYVPPVAGSIDFHLSGGYVLPAGAAANFTTSDIPLPAKKSLRSGVVGAWVSPAAEQCTKVSPIPASRVSRRGNAAPWAAVSPLSTVGGSNWLVAAKVDSRADLPFGVFGDMLNVDRGSDWRSTKFTDDRTGGAWAVFGDMLNEDRGSKWRGAKPADILRGGEWGGFLLPSRRIVPYIRPLPASANFTVVGGGVNAFLAASDDYVPPAGGSVDFHLSGESYTPQIVEYPALADVAPGAANFIYAPVFEPLLDTNGNQIYDKRTRDSTRANPWGVARVVDRDAAHPWLKYTRPLNPGWGIVDPIVNPPIPGESVIIPVRRVYIVLNEFQLIRVDGTVPITASNLTVSYDCDSWLPQFSANIPESARDAIMPDPSPVEIAAVINGTQFRFFVERISRNRQFGQASVNISGRGIACELDAPYAALTQHTNAISATAQQIIDGALVNTGYDQEWNITDWLVPANTFSLFGAPAAVAGAVAEASGSVLAAAWDARTLRMVPRYPTKPWEWGAATPDYAIPAAVTQNESLEWVEKPDYNLVYVSGVQNGVLGQVKKTGTAGDYPAPMVTNSLITHADAARQKGISILSDTGAKTMMQISMPVLAETGIIDLCKLVEFDDGVTQRRGLVRANSISVNWPTVRQTLTIEALA